MSSKLKIISKEEAAKRLEDFRYVTKYSDFIYINKNNELISSKDLHDLLANKDNISSLI